MDKKPVLNLLISGSTYISTIPGVTSAGATPDLTLLTPALDSEILVEGQCKSLNVPPMTPEGLPTPSLVAKACLDLSDVSTMVVDAGMGVKPQCNYLHSGLKVALDGRYGFALPHAHDAVATGRYIAKSILKNVNSVMISESIPGGTTTAQAVLSLLGEKIETSSSFKDNPLTLKKEIISDIVKRHGIQNDPLKAVSRGGDYTQEVILGLLSENEGSEVILSGGTQMGTIYYIASMLKLPLENVEVWTSRQIKASSEKTMKFLVDKDHLKFSHTDFGKSRFEGIRKFEEGFVKEGAGMGGSLVLAESGNSGERIMNSIDHIYESFM